MVFMVSLIQHQNRLCWGQLRLEHQNAYFAPSDNEEALWIKIHALMKERLGTTHILYGFTHSVALTERVGMTRSLFIKHSYDDSYADNFKDQNLLENDIMSAVLYDNLGPFLWDDLKHLPDLSEEQKKRLALDESYQLNVGLSRAFRFSEGRGISGIGLASQSMKAESFAALWETHQTECLSILASFDHTMRPQMVANRLRLTPRQKEALSLSVGGMSAKEIGTYLGITERSVFNILDRARKSLQAGNTIEAVAKALAYNLI
jgi:DNA-binding CsgD family transcriptional regulator